jgi:quinoprotein glucose dehydrogenase
VEDRLVPDPEGNQVEAWIENLEIPWELVFLPDGRALVTELPGRIRLIRNGELRSEPYLDLEDRVAHTGEGGLMGLAVHPEYPAGPYLYVMYTYRDVNLYNGVALIHDYGEYGEWERFVLEGIPGGRIHDGGRIRFGPDGLLYITTGETGQAALAQDRESLAGTILRINPDGSIPEDNPFPDSPVYSYGHRNPQGIDWHPDNGALFSSEHGPSGEYGLFARDNINVIEKGGNYGWPLVLGDANIEPYIDPIIMWENSTPPSGIAFHDSYLYVATLRSEALIRIALTRSNGQWEPTEILRLFARDNYSGIYGRLRNVVVGPDNALYVLTSNEDGRGNPREGDDKILRIVP